MSVTCNNCGTTVQLDPTTVTPSAAFAKQHALTPDDPLIPYVKAQIDDLTAQNSSLVAENDTLSSKLVESTEGRIDLDQQLTVAQMELKAAQKEIKSLQESQKHYEQLMAMIASGQLIEKKDVQPVIENLAYESQRRSQIETSKMKLESELEDLSKSLFEEANRMVNEERKATYLAHKRVEALERQLDEVLDLCKSERDQLVELKVRMGKLSEDKDAVQRERDAFEFALGGSSNSGNNTPPGLNIETASGSRKNAQQIIQHDSRQYRSSASSVKSKSDSCYFSDGDYPGSNLPNDPNDDKIPSLGFHLGDPSFVEFKTYMESIFGSTPVSMSNKTVDNNKTLNQPSSVSSSGFTSIYSFNLMMHKSAPTTPVAANVVIPIQTLLSNCKLFKKISTEDVEATLRFEPGNLLSWTQRKRLMTAVTENTLVVEVLPMNFNFPPPASPVSVAPSHQLLTPGNLSLISSSPSPTPAARHTCGLCGHCITTPLSYQIRLNDTATESRIVCPYCRTRITTVCTFYSVLRMISKRIIPSTTTPEKLYLDFLRVRLGMFLARCGVGIVTGEESRSRRTSSSTNILPAVSAATSTGRNQTLMSAAAAVAAAYTHPASGLPPRAPENAVLPLLPAPVATHALVSASSTATPTNTVSAQTNLLRSTKGSPTPSRETDVIHEESESANGDHDASFHSTSPVLETVVGQGC
ncbi:rab guanine nucleotide exchange factor S2 [Linnemannia zychae]|nr:rab guanine nucleotide exchange factor S2 [Linnemannia zychae]